MPCPHCQSSQVKVRRHGFFTRFFAGKAHTIPRFRCTGCRKTFSAQTGTLTYRERRAEVNKPLFLLLCSGTAQRRCALLAGVNRKTVAKKLVRMGAFAGRHLRETKAANVLQDTGIFDEMETFQHSKCKPLAIAVAVEAGSRRIRGPIATLILPTDLRFANRWDHSIGKKTARLQALVHLYAAFHNARLKKDCPLSMIASPRNDFLLQVYN